MLSMLSHTPSHVRRVSRLGSGSVSWKSNENSFAESTEDDTESLASPRNATSAAAAAAADPQSEVMVEVRPTGDPAMGDGLFATRDIARGTTILEESPILATPPILSGQSQQSQQQQERDLLSSAIQDPSAFCNLLLRDRDLPPLNEEEETTTTTTTVVRALDRLACNPAHVNTETRARVRQWYKDAGATNASGEVLKGKKLQDAAKATVRRYATFLTNRVPIEVEVSPAADSESSGGGGGGGNVGVSAAVFPLYSRVNHSCAPNARRSWDPRAGRLALYAVREIGAGEQVFASYVSYACRTREQRAHDLDQGGWGYGFACACAACVDPDVEVMRQRAFFLSRGLSHWANPVTRIVGAKIGFLKDYVPKDAAEALEWADQLVELLERQELWGPELCKLYREASKYALETGSIQKALDYAYKEVDLGRLLVGTDSEYLGKDAQNADSWVKQLQKERFRNLRQFWERGRTQ